MPAGHIAAALRGQDLKEELFIRVTWLWLRLRLRGYSWGR
jgi:hypothetical protein